MRPKRQPQARKHTADIRRLIRGYEAFRDEYFKDPENSLYKNLVEQGQRPKTLVVACSDSRVDPSILLNSKPGQLFVVRNVANLVPPCEDEIRQQDETDPHYHGTSAALEFAVRHLGVENIVVLGHSLCGGVRALLKKSKKAEDPRQTDFISSWMKIAEEARKKALAKGKPRSLDRQARICEEESLIISVNNLLTFPWIAEKVSAGKLHLHAWRFDLNSGVLQCFNPDSGKFENLSGEDAARKARLRSRSK